MNPKPKKKRTILLILLALLLVTAVVLMVMFLSEKTVTLGGPAIDPNAKPYSGQTSGTAVHSGSIEIPGYPDIPVKAGSNKLGIVLRNPEGNPCLFSFAIVLDETGEELYKSGAVAPGDAIYEETINRSFTAGSYDITIEISTSTPDTGEAMNGAEVKTKLVVA
jgi:hypothetical protein